MPDTIRIRHRLLTTDDLARIDAYRGGATDLHELLAAVLPLTEAVHYEAQVTAQHGTPIALGHTVGDRRASDTDLQIARKFPTRPVARRECARVIADADAQAD